LARDLIILNGHFKEHVTDLTKNYQRDTHSHYPQDTQTTDTFTLSTKYPDHRYIHTIHKIPRPQIHSHYPQDTQTTDTFTLSTRYPDHRYIHTIHKIPRAQIHSRYPKDSPTTYTFTLSTRYPDHRYIHAIRKIPRPHETCISNHDIHLTFRGPCLVIHPYNKNQRDALFLKFILV
jgi:hypothetical protein